jgi:hypothetical protein
MNRRSATTCAVRGSCPGSCGGCQTGSRSRLVCLGVAACQGDGNDVAILALKRIDGALAEPALPQLVIQPTKAPCAPRHALPRHWQRVGLFAWMWYPCHFRCLPPRFGSCPCVRPLRLASGPLACVLQSVHGPSQTRALDHRQKLIAEGC